MPITEVVRVLARAKGLSAGGEAVWVELVYDTDGNFGPDRDAIGFPSIWLRIQGDSYGPFIDEQNAVEAALHSYSARFR
jgi:hypothetical protein